MGIDFGLESKLFELRGHPIGRPARLGVLSRIGADAGNAEQVRQIGGERSRWLSMYWLTESILRCYQVVRGLRPCTAWTGGLRIEEPAVALRLGRETVPNVVDRLLPVTSIGRTI